MDRPNRLLASLNVRSRRTSHVTRVSSRAGRRRRWPWIAVAFLVAIPSCVLLHRYSIKRQIEAKIAAAKTAGFPVTLEELDQWYVEPPAGQNAAEQYAKAFALFTPAEEPEFDGPGEGVAEYVAANAEALKLLHAAAGLKGVWWSNGLGAWTDGWPAEMPDMRRGTRLLGFEAWDRTAAGDATAAVNSVVAILSLSRPLRCVPLVMPQIWNEPTDTAREACEALANEC